jgi:hypothetical protein
MAKNEVLSSIELRVARNGATIARLVRTDPFLREEYVRCELIS